MSQTGGEKSVQFLRSSYCCGLSTTSKRMICLLEELDTLSSFQKQSLINRYITLTEEYQYRSAFFAFIFHGGRTIVTVGSLMVPALLSIQNTTAGGTDITISVYWTTWILSLLVTICNGVLTLFKIDKKYYFLHSVLEHLQSEMWQYIYLTGNYTTPTLIPTHQNQYAQLCSNMEKLKIKQVEEEYYKVSEPHKKKNQKSDDNVPLLHDVLVDEGDKTTTPQTLQN